MRIIIVVLFLFFLGCENKQKIPVVIGLSSSYSSIAKEIKNGMILASDDYSIKFEFIDNKGDINLTQQIDKVLIKEKRPLVIGHITSSITKKVVPLFNGTNTILFSPTASTEELANIDDNFVRIQPVKDFNSIKNILKFMHYFSISRINIVYDKNNKAYANSLIKAFLDRKNKYVKVNKILAIDNDNINKIDLHTPICIIGSRKLSAKMVIDLKQKGFDSMMFVSGSAFTKDFINLTKKYGEGVMFFSTFNPNSDDKKYLEFKEKFISKFGYEPSSFEVKGYEIAKIVYHIIDKQNIKKALINHIFNGLQGKIYINKYGDTLRETHLYIVNNGIFEKVE